MTDKPENPPAFPSGNDSFISGSHEGMLLRDFFAAAALSGTQPRFRSADGGIIAQDQKKLAKYAYEIADAMLKARSHD